ncbi:DNA uptake protein-related DNA-binding protein [Corynebacterium halotolerans YIM 70093 = DSM 44683]|uniref:DNA uptake protein-related DNA-binding protein n=1 Tax=Corynebacterium halotolerans YIM 70093 = DSM 44683 TaxID=1121362 RepID=M1NUK5_9CORY|nr:DNA uptake protein-related DNA-binding protein [Corynebacterium halotolerans YIM 70093 = DSM 44683]
MSRLKELTRPTGEEDLLDVAYPAPRWSVAPRHAVFAAAVVLILVLGWLALRPTPETGAESGTGTGTIGTLAPGEPAGVGLTGVPGLPEATAAGEGEGELVVSVVGEVTRPGLLTLAPGARVADALAEAEPLPGAELLALNQAQRLTDGQQLVVPAAAEAGEPDGQAPQAAAGGTGEGPVSLNLASAAELITLDGVGEKTAEAIIAHREATGGFTAPEQLMDVKGIGPAKFEALRDQVSL